MGKNIPQSRSSGSNLLEANSSNERATPLILSPARENIGNNNPSDQITART
jgi:hypothetical protein